MNSSGVIPKQSETAMESCLADSGEHGITKSLLRQTSTSFPFSARSCIASDTGRELWCRVSFIVDFNRLHHLIGFGPRFNRIWLGFRSFQFPGQFSESEPFPCDLR